MYDLDDDNDSTSTVFRDVIFLALAGFVAIVLLLLPHVNPPKQEKSHDTPLPGNLMVEMFWNDSLDMDIDLWVKAPTDKPVGYSSQNGKLFDLLRDDVGFREDSSNRNFEIAITRGVVSGEYTINVMFYRDLRSSEQQKSPADVQIVVSLKRKDSDSLKKILEKKVKLYSVNEEITVFNFRLNSELLLDKESVNEIYRPLAKSATPGVGGP